MFKFKSTDEINIECKIHVTDALIIQNIAFKKMMEEFGHQFVVMFFILNFVYLIKFLLSIFITIFVFVYNSVIIWNEEESLCRKLIRIGSRLINDSPFFLLYDY